MRHPHHARRAAAARGHADRRHASSAQGGAAVHRQADRAGHDLRRPGGDRDRERAAVRRGAGAHRRSDRIAGAADRDRGSAWVISSSPTRAATGVRHHRDQRARLCDATWSARFAVRWRTVRTALRSRFRRFRRSRCNAAAPSQESRAVRAHRTRAVSTKTACYILGRRGDPDYRPGRTARSTGYRTHLAVPMLARAQSVGAIGRWSQPVRPFTEQQIAAGCAPSPTRR